MDDVRLREGESAVGLWLPLALGSVYGWMLNAFRADGAEPVKMSDILRSWSLPALADAIAKEERNGEAKDMIANFNALAERFGGKRIEV